MLKKASANIPLKYRTALVLRDIEVLSYSRISEVLGCSIGTVESRIYLGRQSLKDELLRLGGGLI